MTLAMAKLVLGGSRDRSVRGRDGRRRLDRSRPMRCCMRASTRGTARSRAATQRTVPHPARTNVHW